MCFVLLDSSRVVLVTRFGFNVDIASELYSVNTLGGLHCCKIAPYWCWMGVTCQEEHKTKIIIESISTHPGYYVNMT